MTQMNNAQVLKFHADECLRIHALCDRAMVPRRVNDTLLSMAQRVEVMEQVLQGLRLRLVENIGGTVQ